MKKYSLPDWISVSIDEIEKDLSGLNKKHFLDFISAHNQLTIRLNEIDEISKIIQITDLTPEFHQKKIWKLFGWTCSLC